MSHAANAFFSSNFDDALILTMDGGGSEGPEEVTAFTVYTFKGNKIKKINFQKKKKIKRLIKKNIIKKGIIKRLNNSF